MRVFKHAYPTEKVTKNNYFMKLQNFYMLKATSS